MQEEIKNDATEEIKEETNEEKVEDKKEEKVSKKETKNKYKEENNKLKEEISFLKNELLRNRADLENFKKRMKEEAIKDRKYASTNLITDIITPLEYLVRAVEFKSDNQEMNNFLIGFKMISNQLMDVLIADGLSVIEANSGDDFNPEVHHAMSTEKNDEVEKNKILEVFSRGYKYKDRIIKPAMVKVSE